MSDYQREDHWSASVLTLVKPDDHNKSNGLDNCNAKTLSDVEQRISILSSEFVKAHSAAQSSMLLATSALVDLKTERGSTTTRKAGVETQKVLSNVGIFLQGFSGIAEIIRSADQQFGGLAYGTVSILATIAVRKTEHEELIEEVLEELSHAFPRLNVLEHIEPSDSLRTLVIGAFEVTIEYCRRTTEYCTARSLRRVKDASLKRDEMLKAASRLRIKLSEIHKQCEIIMMQDLKEIRRNLVVMTVQLNTTEMKLNESNIRLQEIQEKSTDIHATGDDTNNRVREGQAWMERQERSRAQREYLSELRKTLDAKDMIKASDAILQVTALLRRLSEDQTSGRKNAAQMSPAMLKANESFRDWNERSESSMLVLGGCNFVRETDSEPYCDGEMSWLSFASAWYTQDALRNPGLTLSFFGQLNYNVKTQHRKTFWHVVKTFVYQLAQVVPEETLERHEKIIRDTDFSSWNEANDVDAIEEMSGLLGAMLDSVPDDVRVSIVIDRLDQCQWDGFTKNGVDGLGHAVRFLLQLVRHRKIGLKILLVLNSRSAAAITKNQKWSDQFLSVPDWHQEAEE
ncbi:hypothetical protein G6514_006998 [Epicoccum nigrum]|nr:hypothetical protein G6514_006998 [Epicoccum nigrum]